MVPWREQLCCFDRKQEQNTGQLSVVEMNCSSISLTVPIFAVFVTVPRVPLCEFRWNFPRTKTHRCLFHRAAGWNAKHTPLM